MSEQAIPNEESSRPQKNDPIERFKSKYDETIANAKIQAEHTITEGWTTLYQSERRLDRDERRTLGERLKSLATVIQDIGSSEDTEKEIGDVKKQANTLRIRREAFDTTTVEPVRQPVKECEKVIE